MANRILIIKTAALGDVVRTGYVFPFLRAAHPAAHITWFTSPAAIELLKFCPAIDTLTSDPAAVRGPFDWIISLEEENLLPAAMAEHLGSGRKITGCWLEQGQWRYSRESEEWFDMSRISRFGRARADELKKLNRRGHAGILGDMLGITIAHPSFWGAPAASAPRESRVLRQIGLNLSAGKRWPSKTMLPAEARGLLERLLRECDCELLVLGGKDDEAYNRAIMDGVTSLRLALQPPATLLEFAAVIRSLDVIICADTLALHLALSQRVPAVAFFAPTSAVEIDGWGITEKVVSTAEDYCSYRPHADNASISAALVLAALGDLRRRLFRS